MNQPELDPIALDTAWDRQIRTGTSSEEVIAALHATAATPGPSTAFGQSLRRTLLAEALSIGPSGASNPTPASDPERLTRPIPPAAHGAAKWASILAASLLLFAMVAALYQTRGFNADPGSFVFAPDTGSPSPETAQQFPDVPMQGADPQRTNIQPGPALVGTPQLVAHSPISGDSMVLAGNRLIVTNYNSVAALDPRTLDVLWQTNPGNGVYTSPLIAGDVIYLGYSLVTESISDDPANNQLVAMSLKDGSILWRANGAGGAGNEMAVQGQTIYAVGGTGTSVILGAYRTDDGSQIWTAPIDGAIGCCGGLHVVLGDGLAYVAYRYHVSAFDLKGGRLIWTATAPSDMYFGSVAFLDGRVVAPTYGLAATFYSSAAILYLDAATGETIGKVDNAYGLISGIEGDNGTDTLATGWQLPSNSARIWRIDHGTLAPVIDQATAQSPTNDIDYRFPALPPVTVGRAFYTVFSQMDDGIDGIDSSLLSAYVTNENVSGADLAWTLVVDGRLTAMPIVSGGRIFILTSDAGLYALEDTPVDSATPAATIPAAVDLTSPVTCDQPLSDSPLSGELPDAPSLPAVFPIGTTIEEEDLVVVGQPLDEATQQFLVQLIADYRDCSAAEPYRGVFRFFSADFYIRLKALGVENIPGGPAQPWDVWMAPGGTQLELLPDTLRLRPDGRIAGFIVGETGSYWVLFAPVNGTWKIDEYHQILLAQNENVQFPTYPPDSTAAP